MLEHFRGQRVAESQLGEHVCVRGIARLGLAQRGQAELLEEDVRELLGRGDGERLACEREDLAREVVEVALELLGERLQPSRIDAYETRGIRMHLAAKVDLTLPSPRLDLQAQAVEERRQLDIYG